MTQTLTLRTRSSRRTRIIVIGVTVLGLLHHLDHVLRADHSGWPFIHDVTPFTISLLVAYPVVAFVFFIKSRSRQLPTLARAGVSPRRPSLATRASRGSAVTPVPAS